MSISLHASKLTSVTMKRKKQDIIIYTISLSSRRRRKSAILEVVDPTITTHTSDLQKEMHEFYTRSFTHGLTRTLQSIRKRSVSLGRR